MIAIGFPRAVPAGLEGVVGFGSLPPHTAHEG